MLGAPPAVLTKNSRQRPVGDLARTLRSSGGHVTELREGNLDVAQNFGRTAAVVHNFHRRSSELVRGHVIGPLHATG